MPDEERDESLGLEHLPEAELDTPAGSGHVATPVDPEFKPTHPEITTDATVIDHEESRSSKQPTRNDSDRRLETR